MGYEKSAPWFDALRAEYGKVASFAVWPPLGCKDPEAASRYVEACKSVFNPSVVLVGLNPTVDTTVLRDWCAFHVSYPRSREGRMSQWFSLPPFRGAYMTDLIKDVVETDSRKVKNEWKRSHSVRLNAESNFLREMEILGQDDPAIFLLGGVVESMWGDCQRLRRFRAKGIWHYAHQKRIEDMIMNWDSAAKELGLGGYAPGHRNSD